MSRSRQGWVGSDERSCFAPSPTSVGNSEQGTRRDATMPKRVAIEVLERTDTDVHKLVELRARNGAAEPNTICYYTILRVNLIRLDGEGLKRIAEGERIDDPNHIEARVPWIHELGGKLPDSMVQLDNISACLMPSLP